MERITRALRGESKRPDDDYEPLAASITSATGLLQTSIHRKRFLWLEYGIFVLLGVAMLWSWNMFLAAAPYFQARFASNQWLITHFQPSMNAVSCLTNLGVMVLLTKRQENADYPRRILVALVINSVVFLVLAISTVTFKDASAEGYFAFTLVMLLATNTAASFFQNGLWAYVSSFGVPQYLQGIMAGQGVAGILPPIVQIASVLSVPEKNSGDSSTEGSGESYKSAFAYFLTATSLSVFTLFTFLYLQGRHPEQGKAKKVIDTPNEAADDDLERDEGDSPPPRKEVGLLELFFKLKWFALGVFLTFAVTMFFPVFTQAITSVRDRPATSSSPQPPPRLFRSACFIPLAFLFWNAGDLLGRILPTVGSLGRAIYHPKLVFAGTVARTVWLPLYLFCNIHGRGALVPSDFYYLVVVQLLFGVTNGFLGSTCMMAAPEWVEESEKEAAGSFMGLMLVGGLSVGSILSFGVAKA